MGLTAESRDRIEHEIRAHFESARESKSATEADTEVAGLSALESLGDPAVANKAYRKVHLTEPEAKLLDVMRRKRPTSVWSDLYNLAFGTAMIISGLRGFFEDFDTISIWLGTGFITFSFVPRLLPKRSRWGLKIFPFLVPV